MISIEKKKRQKCETSKKSDLEKLEVKMMPTAAIEGFCVSPAGGWVTSAPRKMIGSRNT